MATEPFKHFKCMYVSRTGALCILPYGHTEQHDTSYVRKVHPAVIRADIEPIFIWDGRGGMGVASGPSHIHDIYGRCFKNRNGVYCDATPVNEVKPERKPDPVNHPTHYTSDPSGVECIQITRHRNFNIGNAIKYLWRAGLKGTDSTIQDLEKAIFYINDEIERLRNV